MYVPMEFTRQVSKSLHVTTSQSSTAGRTALAITLIEHAKQRSSLCCRLNCRHASPHVVNYTCNGKVVESFNITGPDQHSSFCSDDCKEATILNEDSEETDHNACEFIDMQDHSGNTALHNAVQRGKHLVNIVTLLLF